MVGQNERKLKREQRERKKKTTGLKAGTAQTKKRSRKEERG